MSAMKLVVTILVLTLPSAVLLHATWGATLARITVLTAWASITTALLLLISRRHRRRFFPRWVAAAAAVGWILLALVLFASAWRTAAVLLAVLTLPAVSFLLIERLGLTPAPRERGNP